METAFDRGAGGALQSAKYLDQAASTYSRADRTWAKGPKLNPDGVLEERIKWRQRYQAQQFDCRGNIVCARFDCCELVKCTLLLDRGTGKRLPNACSKIATSISSKQTESAGFTRETISLITRNDAPNSRIG